MADPLGTVEDAIIQAVKNALQGKIRLVDSLPGAWSIDTLKRILQTAPSVYVHFAGGQQGGDDDEVYLQARFVVYFVSNQASGSKARRRGSAQQIGAYEMMQTAVPSLHGMTVNQVGSLALGQVGVEINEATFDLGATVYSATLNVNKLHWPIPVDSSALADFETYHQDYDLDPDSDDEPVHDDTVSLPQDN